MIPPTFLSLPVELHNIIVSQLPLKDLLSMRATNRYMKAIVSAELKKRYGKNPDFFTCLDFFDDDDEEDNQNHCICWGTKIYINGVFQEPPLSLSSASIRDITFIKSPDNMAVFYLNKKNGTVHVYGNNHCRQLGVGSSELVDRQTLISFPADVIVSDIIAGRYTTFFKTNIGWFTCGNNFYGQLGLGNNQATTVPKQIPLRDIAEVVAGIDHTFFKTKQGEWYACGKNTYGELGLGHKQQVTIPMQIPSQDIAEVVAKTYHTFFKTKQNLWYACGENIDGELGLGHTQEVMTPTQIPSQDIAEVVAGIDHTFFKTKQGEWYACGKNTYGELGLGHKQQVTIPMQIPSQDIAEVVAGIDHTFFKTKQGEWYACGKNTYGELGLGHKQQVTIPIRISFPNNAEVVEIITYDCNTYFVAKGSIFIAGGMEEQHLPRGVSLLIDKDKLFNPGNLEAGYLYYQFKKVMQGLPLGWRDANNNFTSQQPDPLAGWAPVFFDSAFLNAAMTVWGKQDFSNNTVATAEECRLFTALHNKIQGTSYLLLQTKTSLVTSNLGYFIAQAIYYQSTENVIWLLSLLSDEQRIEQMHAWKQNNNPDAYSRLSNMLQSHMAIRNDLTLLSILI